MTHEMTHRNQNEMSQDMTNEMVLEMTERRVSRDGNVEHVNPIVSANMEEHAEERRVTIDVRPQIRIQPSCRQEEKMPWPRSHRIALFLLWLMLCIAGASIFHQAFEILGGKAHPSQVLLIVGFATAPALGFSRYSAAASLLYITFAVIVLTQGAPPPPPDNAVKGYGQCFP